MNIGLNYTVTASAITFLNGSGTTIWNATEGQNNIPNQLVTDKLNASYNHEGDNYMADSTSRGFIGLSVLFFALAILGVGYLIVKKSYDNLNF